jgi:hypothetical protein
MVKAMDKRVAALDAQIESAAAESVFWPVDGVSGCGAKRVQHRAVLTSNLVCLFSIAS